MDFIALTGERLAEALAKQGILRPTQIQEQAAAPITEGRDVIARAPTGTGKTLAYLLPIYRGVESDMAERLPRALILAPSYELAAQARNHAAELWDNAGFTGAPPALLIGGAGTGRQIAALKDKPRVVIGSPGRIAQLIQMKKLAVHRLRTLVLDEGDKLLGGNFTAHVEAILKAVPRDCQKLLFSATVPDKAVAAASRFMREPVIIRAGAAKPPEGISHKAVICERRDKIKVLRGIVHNEPIKRGLVFARDSGDVERLAARLNYHNIKTEGLSAGAAGTERKAAIRRFRDGGAVLLAATDAAARGLDIPGLPHVINMDVPRDRTEYLHRAGRTGRMTASGTVITICTANEKARLDSIAHALDITVAYT